MVTWKKRLKQPFRLQSQGLGSTDTKENHTEGDLCTIKISQSLSISSLNQRDKDTDVPLPPASQAKNKAAQRLRPQANPTTSPHSVHARQLPPAGKDLMRLQRAN